MNVVREHRLGDTSERLVSPAGLDEVQRHRQLVEWNVTAAPYPELTLPALFAAQAGATPEATAVVFRQERMLFRTLAERAGCLARHLSDLGVGPDVLVGVLLERSIDLMVALLGILQAGGAYVPLDPTYPPERLSFMLADASAPVMLTQERLLDRLPSGPARVVCLDRDWAQIEQAAPLASPAGLGPRHLAYVLYTSGSTGRPKGVAIEHRSVAAFLSWAQGVFSPEERRCVYAGTSLCFDISVFELFLPLCHGGTVVLGDSPLELPALPAAREVTLVQAVPSAMDQLLRLGPLPDSVRTVVLIGEAVRARLVQQIYARSRVERVLNCYGPTEATVYATFAEMTRDSSEVPPIGRPLTNTQAYVLDVDLRLLPVGTPGELYLGGVSLARGYLGRPQLTAERFLRHPFLSEPGLPLYSDRIYKTGDMVRYRPDGRLEFLGRNDQQVKLNGHRIELEEIEVALCQLPEIQQAVVQVREEPPSPSLRPEPRLAAYLTPDPHHALPLPGWQLHLLPNGVPWATLNPAEADHLYELIFQQRIYLQHGIRLGEGDCVLDVGANTGLFALFAQLECRALRLLCFEPVPSVVATLSTNISLCGLAATAFAYGLSDAPRTVRFTFYPRWSALSGVYADRAEEEQLSRTFLRNEDALLDEIAEELVADRFEGEQVTCELRTLSQVMREHALERVDLLKVNVEKSELDVLRGVEPQDWPRIRQCVVEVHDTKDHLSATAALLRAQGFTVEVAQNANMQGTGLFMVYARRADRPCTAPVEAAPAGQLADLLPGLRRRRVTVEALRAELLRRLPDYMVPQVYAVLDAMPQTLNGKIDRKALPPLDRIPVGHWATVPYEPPRDTLEQRIAEVWQELLGGAQVGAHDNFFALGGSSRLATTAYPRLRERTGRDLALTDLFRFPTVRALAEHLASGASGGVISVAAGQSRGKARRTRRRPKPD